jgi:hypothetical protein
VAVQLFELLEHICMGQTRGLRHARLPLLVYSPYSAAISGVHEYSLV